MRLKRVEIKAADLLEVLKASIPDRVPDNTSLLRVVYEPTRNTLIVFVMSEDYEEVPSIARSEVIYTQITPVKVNQFAEKGILTERPKNVIVDTAESIESDIVDE